MMEPDTVNLLGTKFHSLFSGALVVLLFLAVEVFIRWRIKFLTQECRRGMFRYVRGNT
jgi:hypothetical protein